MVTENEEYFERLRKAVEARERFLAEHPQLQPLQDEINALMKKMGSSENRMTALEELMRDKTRELQRGLEELGQHLRRRMVQEEGGSPPEGGPSSGRILGPAADWPVIRREPEDEEPAGDEEANGGDPAAPTDASDD